MFAGLFGDTRPDQLLLTVVQVDLAVPVDEVPDPNEVGVAQLVRRDGTCRGL